MAYLFCHFLHSILFFVFSSSLDMEAAIKTLVTAFMKSSKGKENLDKKAFQKLVSNQLCGLMEVRNCITFCCSPSPTGMSELILFQGANMLTSIFPTCFCISLCAQDTNSKSAVDELMQGLDENKLQPVWDGLELDWGLRQ